MEDSTEPHLYPDQNSSFVSRIFFWWALPFFYKNYQKRENLNVYQTLPAHESDNLGGKLEETWRRERASSAPSLWKALARIFYAEFLLSASLFILSELVQPWLIARVMNHIQSGRSTLYTDIFLLILANFLSVIIMHSYQLKVQHLGLKVRVSCCALIFRHSLILGKTDAARITAGKIINLMTNDVNRFDLAPMHIVQLFVAPVETFFVIFALFFYAGVATLPGILFLLFFLPVQMSLSKLIAKYRLQTATKTDKRIKLINEILHGIETIKMHTWENLFKGFVTNIRRLEVRQILRTFYVRASNISSMLVLNRTAIFLSVVSYVLIEKKLDAAYIFIVSTFYAILRQTLTVHFPFGLSHFAETKVSVERIRNFLMSGNQTREVTYLKVENNHQLLEETHIEDEITGVEPGVKIKDMWAKWDRADSAPVLKNICFDARPGGLVLVSGKSGGGKTALLLAILQELDISSGVCSIQGRISYAGQEPWLFSGTIRENICFGEDFDQDRYHNVLNVCMLDGDFPLGGETEVGERGALLSGGQKSRVNLARAVYRNADVYLLDEVFAAIDETVGNKIFEKCILEHLRGKIIILVTNHRKFFGTAATRYEVRDGTLTRCQVDNEDREEDMSLEDKPRTEPVNVTKEATSPVPQKAHKYHNRRIFLEYLKNARNVPFLLLLILLFLLTQTALSTVDYFLAFWVNQETSPSNFYIFLYLGLIVFAIGVSITRSMLYFKYCLGASSRLHDNMLEKVLCAPLVFFNLNHSGEVLNRFSKDTGLVDEVLPATMMDTFQISLLVLGSNLIVIFLSPIMLIFNIFAFVFFYYIRILYLASSRDLKRFEAEARSPLYLQTNSSLQGLVTIRAQKKQRFEVQIFSKYQNKYTTFSYTFLICNRAFAFWLDFICVIYAACAILTMGLTVSTAGNTGLLITQSINMIGLLQWGIRQWSELENQMVNIGRMVEYTKLPPEPYSGSAPATWPETAAISFNNVSLEYVNGPKALKSVSFHVEHAQKIGIVGRTGAGKSSLISALFRLFPHAGTITIGGRSTKELPLSLLRSKISIIPQNPVVFAGTLRENLDPMAQHSDEMLWNILEAVGLRSIISSLSPGLGVEIQEHGANFSVGQKQLICLARALLRGKKILVLDEAASQLDPETGGLLRDVIGKYCGECTVFVIAHNLDAVRNLDKVLVMHGGEMVEFDSPGRLLENKSYFAQLVKESHRQF